MLEIQGCVENSSAAADIVPEYTVVNLNVTVVLRL
jgi:hypothetical protein